MVEADHWGRGEVADLDLEAFLDQVVQVGSAVVEDHFRCPWQQPSFVVAAFPAYIALDHHVVPVVLVALDAAVVRLHVGPRAHA